MDDRVREFVLQVAQTIVGLDVALFFQANPSTFDTPSGIAMRTHRAADDVRPALERLAARGVLERHVRGDGKHICYALSRDMDVWDLLCRVSEAYLDNREACKEIVRMLIGIQQQARAARAEESLEAGGER